MSHVPFLEKARPYAGLGYFISETAKMEFALDRFIFTVNNIDPALASEISKSAPVKIEGKVEFTLRAFGELASLKSEPLFSDGSLDLNALTYSMLEIYEVRNALAHGAVDLLEAGDGHVRYSATRYERTGRGQFEEQRFLVGTYFLAELHHRSVVNRRFFDRLARKLEDNDGWEKNYQIDKESRAGHIRMLEFNEIFNLPPSKYIGDSEVEIVFRLPVKGEGARE